MSDLNDKYKGCIFEKEIECKGKSVLPGFVDAHTHALCPGDRMHEFILKLNGATYMDIHKMGGGIGFTVNCVREKNEEELLQFLLNILKKMSKLGTTCVEVCVFKLK